VSGPRVSLVVEWDNVRLAGASRARLMLERLGEELAAGRDETEVLLVHDGRPGDVAEAQRLLAPTGADVRVLSAPGSDYYELKNAGVRAARGELVVFLDCDIVTEPGWLGEMVAPFADSAIDVVAGSPYLEPAGLWGKSLALASVFRLREEHGEVAPAEQFFANSLAFRRETALAYPFPKLAGTSRVSCVALARRLADANVGVVRTTRARGAHPPPASIGRALRRALAHGRDTVVLSEAGLGPKATGRTGARRVREVLGAAVANRRRVGLPAAALPVALAIAVVYYGTAGVGVALARLAPRAARRIAP
jgi:hypothetical protein